MSEVSNRLIAELVVDLRPVTPLSFARGMVVAIVGVALSLFAVGVVSGFRSDLFTGPLDPIFLIATGSFLMLGIASSVAVVGISRPHVGNEHGGWVWAAAMVALLPFTALVVSLFRPATAFGGGFLEHGVDCLAAGCALGLFTATGLTLWLRQGAPTSPSMAGLLAGIAAGSIGVFSVSLYCAFDDIVHIGLWHSAAIIVSGLVGRLVIPRLIQW
jgi:hypothetical protein